MTSQRSIPRRILVRVLIFMLLIWVLINAGAWWVIHTAMAKLQAPAEASQAGATLTAVNSWIESMNTAFWPLGVAASALLFVILALILWRLLVSCCQSSPSAAVRTKPQPQAHPAADQARTLEAENLEAGRRFFLHLFGVLQKEGRLMDFFSEDLTHYADAQIGAAVRDIHENCKKVIDKYVAPEAVLTQQEGEQITIQADFDPNAVKLIGNVTGQPPFTGVVRHRGWRARKTELPTLSGRLDPALIAPAEVEVS